LLSTVVVVAKLDDAKAATMERTTAEENRIV
jgi:hypothetical protein